MRPTPSNSFPLSRFFLPPIHLAMLLIVLLLWFGMGWHVLKDFSSRGYQHDFAGHLDYTQILVQQRHFPKPSEGWETHQPPLYYLLCSVLSPHNLDRHISMVRTLSLMLGAGVLLLGAWMLIRLEMKPRIQFLVLLAVSMTPKYMLLFMSYNNDCLVIFLSALWLVLIYELHRRPSWPLTIASTIVAVAGLYTKFTFLPVMVSVAVLEGILVLRGGGRGIACRVIAISFTAGFLLLPWLVFHNWRYTHRLFPILACEVPANFMTPHSAWRTILTPPGVTPGEWTDPFAHPAETQNTKKSSYLAYLLCTSIFGEWEFSSKKMGFWLLLWCHLAMYGLALRQGWRDFRSCMIPLGVAYAFPAVALFCASCGPLMDFRYSAWTWLPWIVLYGRSLDDSEKGDAPLRHVTLWVYLLCITLQVSFLFALFPLK